MLKSVINDHTSGLFAYAIPAMLVAFSLYAAGVQADEKPLKGNKVHFSITQSQPVENDKATITFSHVAQGATPQSVMKEINQKMRSAFKVLKQYPEIVAKTSQYRINPVYKKSLISHWRGQQSLTLTLDNRPEQLEILTEIQPYLSYQSMSFSVSESLRSQIVEQLTSKAIQKYRQRAKLIASEFASKRYQLIDTRINTPNSPIPRPLYARAETAMAASSMPAPSVAAGESRIQVQVSGSLLLPN